MAVLSKEEIFWRASAVANMVRMWADDTNDRVRALGAFHTSVAQTLRDDPSRFRFIPCDIASSLVERFQARILADDLHPEESRKILWLAWKDLVPEFENALFLNDFGESAVERLAAARQETSRL